MSEPSGEVYSKRLYGRDAKGATRVWDVSVQVGDSSGAQEVRIVRQYGVLGGKLTRSERVVKQGKNLGKSNATTPVQQAVLEAKALVRSALDSDYSSEPLSEPLMSQRLPDRIFPMLAQEFSKHAKKVAYPCLVQPKLDGVRMIVGPGGGLKVKRVAMRTRTGKDVKLGELAEKLTPHVPPGIFLDGEMYAHGERFEAITSRFKNGVDPGPGTFQYYVYDLYDAKDPALTTLERGEALGAILASLPRGLQGTIKAVETRLAASEADVRALHDVFVGQGYEGIMVRALGAPYEANKRSPHLLKLKTFSTDEFAIVGVVEAEGLDAGTAIFVCTGGDASLTFTVRMRASREERRQLLLRFQRDPASLIGKMLTVQYQELTAYGIPRFPVGIAIREYE